MRRFVVRRVPRLRGLMGQHSIESVPDRNATKAIRNANDVGEIPLRDTVRNEDAQSEASSTVENPWKRTVGRPHTRQISAPAHGNAELAPPRVVTQELFEFQEGPQGQRALMRRDLEVNEERDISSKELPELEFPDFDDDDG